MPDVNWTGPTVGDVIRDLNAKIDGGVGRTAIACRLNANWQPNTDWRATRCAAPSRLWKRWAPGCHVGRGTFVQAPQAPAPSDSRGAARRQPGRPDGDAPDHGAGSSGPGYRAPRPASAARSRRSIAAAWPKGIAEFELWIPICTSRSAGPRATF